MTFTALVRRKTQPKNKQTNKQQQQKNKYKQKQFFLNVQKRYHGNRSADFFNERLTNVLRVSCHLLIKVRSIISMKSRSDSNFKVWRLEYANLSDQR
jgi:hypothetical protein